MSTLASFCPHHQQTHHHHHLRPPPRPPFPSTTVRFPRPAPSSPAKLRLALFVAASSASSSSSFDELHARGRHPRNLSKNSVLLNLIHEIEPLDVSLIQKDVPADTIDAMKRTISSMLGLLPSDQFHVSVEAFWEPLSKLLISSIMTGYTLRNAEYRLCLERNLDIYGESSGNQASESVACDSPEQLPDGGSEMSSRRNDILPQLENGDIEQYEENIDLEGLGEMTPEVQEYIHYLRSRLSSVEEELCDIKRKNSALEMQHFVGEEKNDLLDYLRSLQPEKVAELSEPTCPEVQETIHSVVHGLLATLSPKMYSKAPPPSGNTTSGPLNDGKDDCTELVENTSIHFQPLISVSRDYLARLLFWCMLMGHHLRGLEYRLELMQILALSVDVESISPQGDQVA